MHRLLMVLLLVGLIACQAGIGAAAYFTDTELNANSTFQAWVSSQWVQTTQGDFQAGVLDNVDTSSSAGDVKLEIVLQEPTTSVGSEESWYFTSWSCRAPVTISNPGSTLIDYQIRVDVTYDADMQPDFDDIRFVDSDDSTELSHWRESYIASTSAVFWVKVPSVPSGNKTIYMYYGNSSASSASNVSSTFSGGSFSDTFTDSSKINTTDSFNISVTDGHVEIDTHTNETTLTATGDARVVRQDPNTVHGSETFLALQQYTSSGHQRGFVQFDITSIPQNVTVNDVDFKIYYYLYLAGNPVGQNTRAKRVTGAWTESTITWNNQPDSTISDEVSLNMPGSYGWVNYDADAIVQSWLNGSSTNYGFLVKFDTEYPTPNRCPIFYSKDYADDNYRPKLTVNWTEHETTADLASVLIPNDTSNRLAVGDQLSWNDSEPTNTDIKYQVEYKADGSWELVPDSVLSGNSAGFDASTVDISSVKTDYGQIRLKGSLSTTDVSTTPTVHDWTVTYYYRKYADPEPTASIGTEDGWSRRAPVTINNTGSTLIDYQIRVDVTYDADMQPDFADIRFVDSDDSTELSHWRESYIASTSAVFWVKVPSVPSGNKTIYMYYGNAAASSASDGDATFEFFDDFADGDIADWVQYGSGTVQIADDSGNYVLLKTANNDPSGGYCLFSNGSLSDFEAVFRTKKINSNGGPMNRYGIEDSSFNGYGPRMTSFTSLVSAIERRTGGVGTTLASSSTSVDVWDTWLTVKFRKSGSILEFELYDSTGSLIESIATSDSLYNSFDRFVVHGGWEFYTDDIRVRKYAAQITYVSSGTIASQVLDTGISGATWNALFWDETAPASTSITFEVRASNTSFLPDSGEPPSWVSVGGTSPVTSGLPSGRYLQWRATLTTSDISKTPTLHEVTIDYY